MTYRAWVLKYKGKSIDWDDVSPYQCVDAVKCYVQECFGIITKGKGTSAWGDAKNYYLDFESKSWGGYKKFHAAGFVRIRNTPSFVPMQGDVVIWNNGEYGHIGVADGDGNTKKFYSYDQNWGGKYLHLVKHDYDYFLGVLRPPRYIKDDVNIRSGAGVQHRKLGELKKGERVTIYEIKGKWANIGDNRWISTNYLKELGER